jgi:HAD superfamily hydrolase (TIGR01509 family)
VTKRRTLNARFQRGQIEPDAFFAAIEAANDGLYTAAETRILHDAWLTGEYPGIADVIQRLLLVPSVETALLSNTNSEHWLRHIAVEGRAADFPTVALLKHRHASHLLGAAKPDEAIYRAFERETGFRGEDILFFDDLPENIAAAERCGWRGTLVDHTGDTARQVETALTRWGVFA